MVVVPMENRLWWIPAIEDVSVVRCRFSERQVRNCHTQEIVTRRVFELLEVLFVFDHSDVDAKYITMTSRMQNERDPGPTED